MNNQEFEQKLQERINQRNNKIKQLPIKKTIIYRCGCVDTKNRFKKKPFFTYKNTKFWFGLKYLTNTNYCRYHHNKKNNMSGLIGHM